MSRIRRLSLATAVSAALVACALSSTASGAGRADSLSVIRQITAKYHDVDAALAAGYLPTSECVASPAGTMGMHYVKPSLLGQPVDLRRPPILLYVPGEDGPRLVGVEYFKADADQDLSTDDDRPALLGHDFDGPMEGHGGGMPRHYDLHVWVWKHNPAGTFEEFNPAVSC
jgi:hypothetical protein